MAAGIQIGNTVITSYIVDSYPLQSMSVITFYSVLLNFSAFADPVSLLSCFVRFPHYISTVSLSAWHMPGL